MEWGKAIRAENQNDLVHCAETMLTPGTVLYEALLHKLETRISSKVRLTRRAPQSRIVLSSRYLPS